MPVVGNRIKVASSDTGTGNITLGSAEDGYQTFAAGGISNNDVVRYVITEGSSWEIGKGTYLTSGPTLVRTSGNLLESSTGALLNLGGSATVFVSLADVDVMQTDGGTFSGAVTFNADTNLNGITAGNQAIYCGNGALKLTGGGPQNSRNLVNLSNSAGATIYGGSASTNATLRSTYGVTIDGGDGDVDITGNMTVTGTLTASSVPATSVYVAESTDDNTDYNVLFSDTSGGANTQMTPQQDDGGLVFNPGANRLTVTNATFAGQVYLGSYLYHNGDTDTYLYLSTDDVRLTAGGRQAIRMDEGTDPDILQLCTGSLGGATVSTTGRTAQYGTIPVLEQAQTISANYTVTDTMNAMSIGPTTIASGVTVTVGDGEAWTVV